MPIHTWVSGRCAKCGLTQDSPWRTSDGRHPELCFVTRLGTCGKCKLANRPLSFEEEPTASDRFCMTCLYPQTPTNMFMTAESAAEATAGSGSPCLEIGCGHPLTVHSLGLACQMCSCERYRPRKREVTPLPS